jgi:tRNA nucleotidyltransferase (CCA-adding enzyme)
MKIYLVGGAVRDMVLQAIHPEYTQKITDYDYVVIGASIQDMLSMGYMPVGKDFPVFLHPITKAEYALARTERKIAKGYAGFEFYTDIHITLEQDLLRRDLSINAMALPVDEQHYPLDLSYLIDPFNAKQDLRAGILKHVSDAFVEDPLRILRVARFAARFNFKVRDSTMEYMQNMVQNQELSHLAPERIWRELQQGLGEQYAYRFLEILHECNALHNILPEFEMHILTYTAFLKAHINIDLHSNLNLDLSLDLNLGSYIFLLFLLHIHVCNEYDSKQVSNIIQRLKLSKDITDVAISLSNVYTLIHAMHKEFNLDSIHKANNAHYIQKCLKIMDNGDALRRPIRFNAILNLCNIYYASTLNLNADKHAVSAMQKHINNIHYYASLCKNISGQEMQSIATQAQRMGADVKAAILDFRVQYIIHYIANHKK